MIKLFLAEDQALLLSALATLLGLENDLMVVGTASNGATALSEIQRLQPDVVILDIEMPELTGLEVARRLRATAAPVKIIILTTFAQAAYFQKAVSYRVDGYLLKDSQPDKLIATIHDVLAGDTIFAPELVHASFYAAANPLTAREMEVLRAIDQGLTTLEVARSVYISHGTARNYISSILAKLGATNRIEAINIAKEQKWL